MINNLQNILTQDHLYTSDPLYVVYSKQEIVVDPDHDHDKLVYVRDNRGEYDELDYETYQDLESQYNEATDYRSVPINGEIPKDPFDDEENFNPDDWEQKAIKLIDKFEQAFFIRQNAENYICNNSHNLGDGAFVYVESAYRNNEWQAIRKMLVDKALIASSDVSV